MWLASLARPLALAGARSPMRASSSERWQRRQARDPYVARARLLNYRARSAFKLWDLQRCFQLLRPGHVVLECGCAPGAWSQVAAPLVNAGGVYRAGQRAGLVLGCDLLPVEPVLGATLWGSSDFTQPEVRARLRDHLAGRPVDVVLSDMAPSATGHGDQDHEAILRLVYSTLQFGLAHARVGSHLVVKVWSGGRDAELAADLARFYRHVERCKPPSSRPESPEVFFVARQFRGLRPKSAAGEPSLSS